MLIILKCNKTQTFQILLKRSSFDDKIEKWPHILYLQPQLSHPDMKKVIEIKLR